MTYTQIFLNNHNIIWVRTIIMIITPVAYEMYTTYTHDEKSSMPLRLK